MRDVRARAGGDDRAVRVYRALLRWFPSRFRIRFGRAAIDLFRDQHREACRRGGVAPLLLWGRTLADIAWHGSLERLGGAAVWMARIGHGAGGDLRAVLHGVRRSPGYSAAAVLCIGLGIAASGAVLTLFSASVLKPLPFPEADRLVRIWRTDPGKNPRIGLAFADIEDLDSLATIDRLVTATRARLYFLSDAEARRVEGEAITPGYFDLLGVTAWRGRLFGVDDYAPGAPPVMLLAYGTWRSHFGGDPSVVGSTVRTSERDYTVVGILPQGFYGTIEEDIPDLEFWVPIGQYYSREDRARRDYIYTWTIGHLRPLGTIAQADAEVDAVARRLTEDFPEAYGPTGLRVEPMGENWRGRVRDQNYLLALAAGLLLIVATVNVAGLLVARTLDRGRELAIRAALGAGRTRLARLVLLETLMLTLAGAAIGLAAAPAILDFFLRQAPEELPLYMSLRPDALAMGLAVVLVATAAVLAGAIPAHMSARTTPGDALRAGGRAVTHVRRERWIGGALATAEVAVSMVVVILAGLLFRSYRTLIDADPGYRRDGILRMAIFPSELDVDRLDLLPDFHERLRAAVLAEPGVTGVTLMTPALPPSVGWAVYLHHPAFPVDVRRTGLRGELHAVDSAFFPLLGIRILAGRNIRPGDGPDQAAVVVVSRAVAEAMGGTDRAVGQRFMVGSDEMRVVGVVADVRFGGPLVDRPPVDVYGALPQFPRRILSLAVATDGDPAALIGPLRKRLHHLAPGSPLDWVNPMRVELADRVEGPRFYLLLVGAFAWSAVALTAVGIFALLVHQVARQRHEFGIRQALGAGGGAIVSQVVRRGLRIALLGVGVGSVAATFASRALQTGLYGVGRFDPWVYLTGVVTILVVAIVASALPALRAARVAPAQALRAQ